MTCRNRSNSSKSISTETFDIARRNAVHGDRDIIRKPISRFTVRYFSLDFGRKGRVVRSSELIEMFEMFRPKRSILRSEIVVIVIYRPTETNLSGFQSAISCPIFWRKQRVARWSELTEIDFDWNVRYCALKRCSWWSQYHTETHLAVPSPTQCHRVHSGHVGS